MMTPYPGRTFKDSISGFWGVGDVTISLRVRSISIDGCLFVALQNDFFLLKNFYTIRGIVGGVGYSS